jgi:hypothetical protein
VVVAEGFVLIADSRGNFPNEYLEEHTASVSRDELVRFLDEAFRPTHASVDCSIPYDTVFRGAELRGHNLLNVPASLTDRVQICRSARGASKDSGRRYVGIYNGRLRQEVSEDSRRTFELQIFVDWAIRVAKILKSKVAGSELFERYMPNCTPPADPIPKTLSLDLVRDDLTLTSSDGSECALKTSSSAVEQVVRDGGNIYMCSFAVEGAKRSDGSIKLRIEYKPAKRRFWFNKDGGVSVGVTLDGESSRKGLAEFLNQKQDIVLIGLGGGEMVYQGRNFYRIDYSYAEDVLLHLIERPAAAPPCTSEKGSKTEIARLKKTKAKKFQSGSLFRAIADQKIGLPFTEKVLICDDLGTEGADFIAANFAERQLAFMHAKAGDRKLISASAFHDVVAQAMKNLVYLTRNAQQPDGVNRWSRSDKWNNTGIPRLYRAPSGTPVKQKLWDKIKSTIIDASNPDLLLSL